MIFVYLESFENKRFKLDFLIFQKPCFYGQSTLERWIFFHSYIFFRTLLLFSIWTKILKVSDHFVEKIQRESTTLNAIHRNLLI